MKVYFRHARYNEELNFTTITAISGWDAVVENIIDQVDLDRSKVGVVVRNRQVHIHPGEPMRYQVEIALRHILKGKDWEEVDEGWHGLPALLMGGFPTWSSPPSS